MEAKECYQMVDVGRKWHACKSFTAADLARLYQTLTDAFNTHFRTTEYEFCAPWCAEGGFEMRRWPGRAPLAGDRDPFLFKQIRFKQWGGTRHTIHIPRMTGPNTEWANTWLSDAKFGDTKILDFGDSFNLQTKSRHQHWTPAELRLFKSVFEEAGFVGPIKFWRFVKQQNEQTRAQKAALAEKNKKKKKKKKTLPLRV